VSSIPDVAGFLICLILPVGSKSCASSRISWFRQEKRSTFCHSTSSEIAGMVSEHINSECLSCIASNESSNVLIFIHSKHGLFSLLFFFGRVTLGAWNVHSPQTRKGKP
jgi:hypothetical protein